MGLKSLSKFLSFVLRHNPESIGLKLDEGGWAKVPELIEKARRTGRSLDVEIIEQIINQGSKQRFILSDDKKYIRAGYGHSIGIDLGLEPKTPPETLYHGSARQNIASILKSGLHSVNRDFVHLSANPGDAREVGSRHGKAVILSIKAAQMSSEGYNFYQSESEPDIWLSKSVPAKFLSLINSTD